jgi:hypothetical protein
LNCSHRRPRAFDSANLLLARPACIVGFLHVNRNARPPGLIRSQSNAVLVWNEGLVFPISHRPIAIETLPGSMPCPICNRRLPNCRPSISCTVTRSRAAIYAAAPRALMAWRQVSAHRPRVTGVLAIE